MSSKKFENASQFKISPSMISMFKPSRTIILVFQHGIYLNLTNTYVSGFNKHSDDTANLLFAVADRSTSCERRGSWIVTEICKLRCLRTSPNNGYKRCTNIWKLCTRPVLAGIVEMPVTQKVQLENTPGTKIHAWTRPAVVLSKTPGLMKTYENKGSGKQSERLM